MMKTIRSVGKYGPRTWFFFGCCNNAVTSQHVSLINIVTTFVTFWCFWSSVNITNGHVSVSMKDQTWSTHDVCTAAPQRFQSEVKGKRRGEQAGIRRGTCPCTLYTFVQERTEDKWGQAMIGGKCRLNATSNSPWRPLATNCREWSDLPTW